jgi:protein SCO1/2
MRAQLVVAALLLTACAAPAADPHAGHNTTPTIAVSDAAPAPYGGTSLNSPLPASLTAMEFADHSGRTFTLADYLDKTVILTNFLTSCQDAGPLTSTVIMDAAQQLSVSDMKDEVVFIEVTVDAHKDDAQRLLAYANEFGFGSNVILATSTANNLDTLWNYFGVPATLHELAPADVATYPHDWQTNEPAKYHFMHANLVALIDKTNTWRWMNSGNPDIAQAKMPESMQNFLSPAGKELLNAHDEFSWTAKQIISAIEEVMGHSINS